MKTSFYNTTITLLKSLHIIGGRLMSRGGLKKIASHKNNNNNSSRTPTKNRFVSLHKLWPKMYPAHSGILQGPSM